MKFDLGLPPDADPETVSSELLKCMEAFLNPAEALLVCSKDCFCVILLGGYTYNAFFKQLFLKLFV